MYFYQCLNFKPNDNDSCLLFHFCNIVNDNVEMHSTDAFKYDILYDMHGHPN
jgi:hypothetical protein